MDKDLERQRDIETERPQRRERKRKKERKKERTYRKRKNWGEMKGINNFSMSSRPDNFDLIDFTHFAPKQIFK